MADKLITETSETKKGERMTPGAGWELKSTKGTKRSFRGTLLGTFNHGATHRIAVFSVPRR
jgi:hypothetical protein